MPPSCSTRDASNEFNCDYGSARDRYDLISVGLSGSTTLVSRIYVYRCVHTGAEYRSTLSYAAVHIVLNRKNSEWRGAIRSFASPTLQPPSVSFSFRFDEGRSTDRSGRIDTLTSSIGSRLLRRFTLCKWLSREFVEFKMHTRDVHVRFCSMFDLYTWTRVCQIRRIEDLYARHVISHGRTKSCFESKSGQFYAAESVFPWCEDDFFEGRIRFKNIAYFERIVLPVVHSGSANFVLLWLQ